LEAILIESRIALDRGLCVSLAPLSLAVLCKTLLAQLCSLA
jgi:hypothetical protein